MKVAILAEQNFNLIDGSTIWLLNVCKLMALVPELKVSLLLTHKLTDPILANEVPASLRLVDAAQIAKATGMAGDKLEAVSLAQSLCAWEAVEGRFDRFFVRGESYLTALLEAPDFLRRVVGYAPGAIPDLAQQEPRWLSLGRAARTPFVVQSEPAKHAMESLFGYPAHVVHVVPPIVFHDGHDAWADRDPNRAILCYSGKIDLHYGLDWLIALARRLQNEPGLGVSVIAGKDTWRTRYPDFFRQMDQFRADIAAGHLPHVSLASGLPHSEAKAQMAKADFAWCLRHARYDDVIEISTKIVEFCTAGVVPILNDTALNRALFGDDYPYLIDIVKEDAEARAIEMLRSKGSARHQAALHRIAEVAAKFRAERLAGALGAAILGRSVSPQAGQDPALQAALALAPRKIHLATHDAKFLRQFLDQIQSDSNLSITYERWVSTVEPEDKPSIPDGTDTVFCEWACGNAIWHSQNKAPGTKLIVRLHRFEAFRDFPAQINWAAVDGLIVVSDYFRDLMAQRYGIERAKIHVMPQFIDWHQLRRPKLDQARFTLGLVGINPFNHKRFDRAIDFLAALRAQDRRFQLAVRSLMPWQINWVWNRDAAERSKFIATFQRIYRDPAVAGAVRFDPAGPDMEEWYRGIGTILSSSDSEGCHTSVMEAMASGAQAIVYDWPGAGGLFPGHVYSDMAEAIPNLIAFTEAENLAERRESLSLSMKKHDIGVFTRRFFQL